MVKGEINYNNDVYFKFSLGGNDKDSKKLRRTVIKERFSIDYKEVKVKNPIKNITHYNEKSTILDILLENEKGERINLEMQVSLLNEFFRKRIQYYGCEQIVDQIKQGEPYNKIQRVYQIIFIADAYHKNKLYDTFTSKNENGEEEEFNLITRTYVYMPFINEIIKTKKISELTDFEKLVYVFQNNVNNDILNIEKGQVSAMNDNDDIFAIMKRKMNDLMADDELRAYALSREMGRQQHEYEQNELKRQKEELAKDLEKLAKSQEELTKGQEELTKGQEELTKGQEELTKGQEELTKGQEELTKGQEELIKEKEEILVREKNMIEVLMNNMNYSLEEALTFLHIPLENIHMYR